MFCLDAKVLPNGNLKISADNENRAWMDDYPEGTDDSVILDEGFEHYWATGSFYPFNPESANPFIGLTSAPCIAESMDIDDNGKRTVVGRLWWFPQYQTTSVIDELVEVGEVVFTLVSGTHVYERIDTSDWKQP